MLAGLAGWRVRLGTSYAGRGRTWTVQRGGSKLPQIVAIRFRDSLNGWAVGRQGTLLETTDGGRIWREIDAGTKQDLYGIWVDGQHGLIVGQGVISKTNNGGSDWVPVASTPTTLWLSGVTGNGDTAIAVGQAGTIRKISLSEPSQNPSPREATAP